MNKLKKIDFKVGTKKLYGLISDTNAYKFPSILFLHGSGRKYGKEAVLYLINRLRKKLNYNFLTFDFSGCGESTGYFKGSSLKKRFFEAIQATQILSKPPVIAIGTSMGGYIAIKLLEKFKIETLILFCPAVYDQSAFNVDFNKGFTEIIRIQDSWKNSDIFLSLKKYKGNILLIIGEKDEIIPKELISVIFESATNVKKKELVIISNCPHDIHTWLAHNHIEADKIAEKILEFIKK